MSLSTKSIYNPTPASPRPHNKIQQPIVIITFCQTGNSTNHLKKAKVKTCSQRLCRKSRPIKGMDNAVQGSFWNPTPNSAEWLVQSIANATLEYYLVADRPRKMKALKKHRNEVRLNRTLCPGCNRLNAGMATRPLSSPEVWLACGLCETTTRTFQSCEILPELGNIQPAF
jgi:hypothetical protein